MKIELPLTGGFGLQLSSRSEWVSRYPTASLQKGLVLFYREKNLAEEAVGLGVPIVKRGLQTIFPSEADLYLHGGGIETKVSARYTLNLEERIARNGNTAIKNRFAYTVKNSLAAAIRKIPLMRSGLTSTSNLLRTIFAWETTYELSKFSTHIVLTYSIDEIMGKIKVELAGGDFRSNSLSEIIVMNELGAHHFDQYQESGGVCQSGEDIGCWDEVIGEEAAFIDRTHKISFGVRQVNGAKLYRGRELIEPRLAWAGFGYSFAPNLEQFEYEITLNW